MSSNITRFDEVLGKVSRLLSTITLPEDAQVVVIRDIFGRASVALSLERSEHPELFDKISVSMLDLGAFAARGDAAVLSRDDLFDPTVIFESPDLQTVYPLGLNSKHFQLLDRLVVGEDWLTTNPLPPRQHRIVFFGVKGGVGRSTALAILAYFLASKGKKVLLVDFDLESPGLSGLLLPEDRLADFGLVDWFVEDAVGQGQQILDKVISVSPLSEYTQGEIRIASAMGHNGDNYLDKLSRVYADVTHGGGVERFSDRARRLVSILEEREQPDVVLIDSRAGLHDLAAVSIVGLSTIALLFATDTSQTWQGYNVLFKYWQKFPDIVNEIRVKLNIVEALLPEVDQVGRASSFLEHSYSLFSNTIYDAIDPSDAAGFDLFNFDINDSSSPHYPLLIKWNNRFQEFDPLLLTTGTLTDSDIEATYGDFIEGVINLIEGEIP